MIRKEQRNQKERIRNGITGLLASILGENHELITKVRSCDSSSRNIDSQTGKMQYGYCREYLLCNTCNLQRYRLAKSIFLAGHKDKATLYSVTITPKSAYSQHDVVDVLESFNKMEAVALKKLDSFLGSKEIKSSVVTHDNNSIWPHMHLIATSPKDSFSDDNDEDFSLVYRVIPLNEWERTLQHHFKPLIFSWFPVKEETSNMPVFENFKLNKTQQGDCAWIIENLGLFVGEEAKINQISCYGDFNFENIFRPEQRKFREFLNSSKLEATRVRCNRQSSTKVTKPASRIQQKWFTKVAVYLFYLLDDPGHTQKAIHLARLSPAEQRSLQREVCKYKSCVLPLVIKAKSLAWKAPKDSDQVTLAIRELALKGEDKAGICQSVGLSDSQVSRYLTSLDLGHSIQREAARTWFSVMTDSAKNKTESL